MHKKQLKRAAAFALSAVMALTSSGMASLADIQTKGDLEEGYKLVELNANGGKFDPHVKMTKGSPSEASPSQLEWVASPSDATVFAVYPGPEEDAAWLTEEDLDEAAVDLKEPEGANPEPVWLTKKDDPASAIKFTEEGYKITANKTTLYAGWYMSAAIDSEQLDDDAVSAFGIGDKKLTVEDLPAEERKDKEELEKQLGKKNPGAYRDIDVENALQLNMLVDNYDKGATLRVKLPADFQETTRNRSVVVIHYSTKRAGEVDVIDPEVTYADDDETISAIDFTLKDFSPVIIATVDKMVNVKLENVKGGYAVVYEESTDEQGKKKNTYLPLGETVKVKAGTNLTIRCEEYDADLEKVVIKEDDASSEISSDYYEWIYIVNAKYNNVTITPVFKPYEYDGEGGGVAKDNFHISFKDTSDTSKSGKVTGKLTARKNGKKIEATNWKMIEGSKDNDNDLFTLEPDGTLISKDILEIDVYHLDVSFEYEGKTIKTVDLGQYGRQYSITVGSYVYFGMYLGKYEDSEEYVPFDDYLGTSELFEGGKLFKDVLADTRNGDDFTEPAMFGDYTFAGWYDEGRGEIKDDKAMHDYTDALAGFINKNGKFYSPIISSIDSPDTPVNPDDQNKPDDSGSGSHGSYSGGGGSSSSRDTGYMYGTWEQDANGWRFKQSNGKYATNQWGRINNIWYFFGADTYMETGWIFWNNNWYYLNTAKGSLEGAMQTDWVYDTTFGRWFYLDTSGAMVSDWKQINNVWYYFNTISDGTKGAMLSDQWIGDYYVNGDGAWVEGMTK